ncbi:hypothetical protein HRbin31_00233 [bacterium HR31]|nr:hypothetical protein HRbin31_00233 [bacterium HR31]
MIRALEAPRARAASTKSVRFSLRTSPRTRRAVPIQPKAVITATIPTRLPPK